MNTLGQSKTENFGALDQLVEQVQQWSIDKDLHNGNSDRQALKFYEEAGEVASALSRGQMDALKDGIGDTVVTLIILAQQHDMTLQECLQYAYDEIKGRKGKTINGTFIKEADLKEQGHTRKSKRGAGEVRATFCGLIGMFIISLLFQLVGTEVKDEWDYGFLFLVFTICAISQLIKQVKE